jgi:hypothetical protein
MDGKTGRNLRQTSQPVVSDSLFLLGLPDGNIFTCLDNVLREISPVFETISEQKLSSDYVCPRREFYRSQQQFSPGRDSILFSGSHPNRTHEHMLCKPKGPSAYKRSDDVAVVGTPDSWLVGFQGAQQEFVIRSVRSNWRPFQTEILKINSKDWFIKPFFAADHILVNIGDGRGNAAMEVVTADGKDLFVAHAGKKKSFGEAVTSTGQDRFAVIGTKLKGSEGLDMSEMVPEKITEFSISECRAIFELEVDEGSPWIPWTLRSYNWLYPQMASLSPL